MSNGIVSSACCCGPCTSCCSWWAASPTGPVNFQLQFYQDITCEIGPGGQFMTLGYTAWTIDAVLTKSGSCCDYNTCGPSYANLMRYTASSCEVSATSFRKIYSFGFSRKTCFENYPVSCVSPCHSECICQKNPLQCTAVPSWPEWVGGTQWQFNPVPDPNPCAPGFYTCGAIPCTAMNGGNPPNEGYSNYTQLNDDCYQWNCKKCATQEMPGECECSCKTVPELLWKLMYTETRNYTGTVLGSGSAPGCPDDGQSPPYVGVLDPVCGNAFGNYARPPQAGAGAVITIYCGPNICGDGCFKPTLLFTPGAQVLVTNSVEYDATMNPCCPSGYCPGSAPYTGYIPQGSCFQTSTSNSPICLPRMTLQGSGASFDSSTFDKAVAGCWFDATLGMGMQTATGLSGAPFDKWARYCSLVNWAECQKLAWDHDSEVYSGSPYWPGYCAKAVFVSCEEALNYERCFLPNFNEKYCINRTLGSTVS